MLYASIGNFFMLSRLKEKNWDVQKMTANFAEKRFQLKMHLMPFRMAVLVDQTAGRDEVKSNPFIQATEDVSSPSRFN